MKKKNDGMKKKTSKRKWLINGSATPTSMLHAGTKASHLSLPHQSRPRRPPGEGRDWGRGEISVVAPSKYQRAGTEWVSFSRNSPYHVGNKTKEIWVLHKLLQSVQRSWD